MDSFGARYEGWVCPRCGDQPLSPNEEDFVCARCGTRFPIVGSLPCLTPDPERYRALWDGRLARYRSIIRARAAALTTEAELPHLLERTRQRLRHLASTFLTDLTVIERLISPLLDASARSAAPLADAAAEDGMPLLQCYEHLHRDWAWGDAENAVVLSIVRALAPDPVQKIAVLGVGTGRLAADLQRELRPAFTIGMDKNPLPLLASSALLSGETLELHEYPVAPRRGDATAIRQRLSSPFPRPDGLHLALADALQPPLAPASMDLVVTPWLIDALGVDVRVTCRAVARLLPPGGVWANVGPLRFHGSASSALPIEEVLEVVTASGFAVEKHFQEDVPYFHSPSSGSRSTDTVFAFSARRTTAAPEPWIPPPGPAWLLDPTLPIPLTPKMAAERTRAAITASVLSLIDGSKSIRDLAQFLAREWRTPPEPLETQIGVLLSRFGAD